MRTKSLLAACFLLLLACHSALLAAPANDSFAEAKPADETRPPTDLEDPVAPLEPAQARSSQQHDAIKASALISHGRILYQRQDLAGALARYQRGWRYDESATSILSEIVAIAFDLKRDGEAVRYAILSAERNPADSKLIQRLAAYLAERNEYTRALNLYRKALALEPANKATKDRLIIEFEIARLAFLAKEYQQSATSFAYIRDALERPEKFALDDATRKQLLREPEVTYMLIAEAFFEAGRYDEADAMFRKANELKADEPTLAFHRARISWKRKDAAGGLRRLQRYFDAKISSAGTEPYELLRDLLDETAGDKPTGDKADASKELSAKNLREQIETLAKAQPENAPLALFQGEMYLKQGELELADAALARSLKLKPTLRGFELQLETRQKQGNIPSLLDLLGEAILDVGALESLGEQVEKLVADKATIEKLLQAVRDRVKSSSKAYAAGQAYAVGLLAIRAKLFDAADEMMELALKQSRPEAIAHCVSWGLEMMVAEQFTRSAKALRRAIAIKPMPDEESKTADLTKGKVDAQSTLYFYLAGALAFDDKIDEAVETAKRAISLSPGVIRFHTRVPWIYQLGRRYDDAEREYRKLLKQYDGNYANEDARDAVRDARMALSNIALHRKNYSEADEWLEKVLDENPEDIGALNDLGYLWADRNLHLDRALMMVERAVKAEPENKSYRDSLGWVYYRQGKYAEALKELEIACSGDKPDGVILDHLGDIYWKLGDSQRALASWKRAVSSMQADKHAEQDRLKDVEAKIKQPPPK